MAENKKFTIREVYTNYTTTKKMLTNSFRSNVSEIYKEKSKSRHYHFWIHLLTFFVYNNFKNI